MVFANTHEQSRFLEEDVVVNDFVNFFIPSTDS